MSTLRHPGLLLFLGLSSGVAQADQCPPDSRWGLVIDAGSSGSRLYFYCWKEDLTGALPVIADLGNVEQEPGIADPGCRLDPGQGAASLSPLLAAAEARIEPTRRQSTPLSVIATAGLRLCPREYQERSLAAIRALVENSEFRIERVDLISGQEEARYGWAAVNYLRTGFDPDKPTVGALDLGGASTQLTFESAGCSRSSELCTPFDLGGHQRPLYSQSFLGWGQDEAMRRVSSPACSVRGYRETATASSGRGRYSACQRAIRRTLRRHAKDIPDEHACSSSCNPLGSYQPPVAGDFIAFSAFAYTADFLDLDPQASLRDFERAGKKHCSMPWQEVVQRCEASGSGRCDPYFLNRYCFSAAYIVTLLHHVYGIPKRDSHLLSTNTLDGSRINWTLGAMLETAHHRRSD